MSIINSFSRISTICALVSLLTTCKSQTTTEKVEDKLLNSWDFPGGKSVLINRTTYTDSKNNECLKLIKEKVILGVYTAVGGKPCYMYREYNYNTE